MTVRVGEVKRSYHRGCGSYTQSLRENLLRRYLDPIPSQRPLQILLQRLPHLPARDRTKGGRNGRCTVFVPACVGGAESPCHNLPITTGLRGSPPANATSTSSEIPSCATEPRSEPTTCAHTCVSDTVSDRRTKTRPMANGSATSDTVATFTPLIGFTLS